MGSTLIEKIISEHAGKSVRAGDVVDMGIDVRIARDFGGANVVKNIEDHGLSIDNPDTTFFTFDCNPCGSDQKYAANQQICRIFARSRGIRIFDIDNGIGTHLAIDNGLILPGGTLVSTDSHANIIGAIGGAVFGIGTMLSPLLILGGAFGYSVKFIQNEKFQKALKKISGIVVMYLAATTIISGIIMLKQVST